MQIDIEDLRKTTQEAIQRGREEATRRLQEKAAENAALDARMVAVAEAAVASIPAHCRVAAEAGRTYAMVYKETEYARFKSDFKGGGWTAKILSGPGLLVIDACRGAGLKVEVRHNHDGVGVHDWAEIFVSWD